MVGAGDAHIDTNNSNVFIIIPASDNVHGLVQFSALTGSVSEGDGTVDVTVSRNGGLEGDLFINFTVQDGLAVSPNDYQLNASGKCPFIYLINSFVHLINLLIYLINLFIHSSLNLHYK